MKQRLKTVSPLSPHRAFVVQFQAETDVEQGRVLGRAEHVVSGQAVHFALLEELLAFMGSVLTRVRPPPYADLGEREPIHLGGGLCWQALDRKIIVVLPPSQGPCKIPLFLTGLLSQGNNRSS